MKTRESTVPMLILYLRRIKRTLNIMACEVCGEDNIEKDKDGWFYCELCQSQYKNKRVLEESEENTFVRKKTITLAKKKTKQSSVKSKNYGEAWTSTEAFNIVLHAQVEELIKLGASADLRKTVLTLWTKYLCMCGLGFAREEQVPWKPPFSMCVARSRDIQVSWMGRKIVSFRRMAAVPEATRRSERLKVQRSERLKEKYPEDKESLLDPKAPIIKLQLDYLKRAVDENEDIDCNTLKCIETLKGMLGKRRRTMGSCIQRSPQFMTMAKTICFCYLGLLYLQEQILLSDIVWWIREGIFPYLDASRCLSSTMKFQNSDFQTFSPKTIPTLGSLYMDLGKVIKFLDLPVPPIVPLEPVIARFIIQLDLPAEMCGLVKRMVDIRKPKMAYDKNHPVCVRFPSAEGRALSFIIMTLKALFGMDGVTERNYSLHARMINENNSGKAVFVWDDWVEYTSMKDNYLKAYHVPWALKDITEVSSIENLVSYYHKTMKNWLPPDTVIGARKGKGYASIPGKTHMVSLLPEAFKPLTSTRNTVGNVHPLSSFSKSANFKFYAQKDANLLRKDFTGDTILPLYKSDIDFKNLTSESCYWYHHVLKSYLRCCFLKDLPSSFLWLLDSCSSLVGYRPIELYEELQTAERLVLKCGLKKMATMRKTMIEKNPW